MGKVGINGNGPTSKIPLDVKPMTNEEKRGLGIPISKLEQCKCYGSFKYITE